MQQNSKERSDNSGRERKNNGINRMDCDFIFFCQYSKKEKTDEYVAYQKTDKISQNTCPWDDKDYGNKPYKNSCYADHASCFGFSKSVKNARKTDF